MLLTGGLGYLGGRLAQTLAAGGCELTLGTRRAGLTQPSASGARIVTIDWMRDADLQRACAGMDAVVHLAGMNAADSQRDPVAALEFNGVGTARMVRAATKESVGRFVYLSTAHVYGAALRGCVDELKCPEPRHAYATSHRAGEDAVRLARVANQIDGIVVRLSNSFGAPVDPEVDCWTLVTNDLCRQAVIERLARLRSAGNQRRDFIPMSEACRAITHLLLLPASEVGDGLFNVGGGWAPTMLELANLIAARVEATLGFRPRVETGSAPEGVGGDDLEYRVTKLVATGFQLRQGAIQDELDQLIAMCARQPWGVRT